MINIDLPGTGQSAWDSSIKTIHDIADCVVRELPDEAIYVGWSFGGLVAQAIAVKYPNRVKHIVGIGTTPRFIEANNWPGFPAAGFSAVVDPLLKDGKEAKDFLKMFYEFEFESINPKPDSYSEAQKLWSSPSTISNNLLSERIAICDTTDLRDLFKSITCPIDLIMGDLDTNIPKEAFANIKSLNPNVKIHELVGVGHAPFWTHQQEFNKTLNSVLSMVGRG